MSGALSLLGLGMCLIFGLLLFTLGIKDLDSAASLRRSHWDNEYQARLCGLGEAGLRNLVDLESINHITPSCLQKKFNLRFESNYGKSIQEICFENNTRKLNVRFVLQNDSKNSNWYFYLDNWRKS